MEIESGLRVREQPAAKGDNVIIGDDPYDEGVNISLPGTQLRRTTVLISCKRPTTRVCCRLTARDKLLVGNKRHAAN